jgi:hypothetical protein
MAQKKENLLPIPKTDTVKTVSKGKFPRYFALKSDQSPTGLYKMLIKKPNDTIIYLALKNPQRTIGNTKF